MNTEKEIKINDIVSGLTAYSEDRYSRWDELKELRELRRQIIAKAYENSGEENRYRSLFETVNYLDKKNSAAGNPADEELKNFGETSKNLYNLIEAEKSGFYGEQLVMRSLETLDTDAIILRNIGLEHESHKSEIDFIVITSKALFIIEVKNPHRDIHIDEAGNYYRFGTKKVLDSKLGEKMNDRVYLVKNALSSAGLEIPVIEKTVVFSNSEIDVQNDYPYITHCFLSSLPHIIDEYNGFDYYGKETMENMAKAIKEARVDEYYPLKFDSLKYKRDFATLLVLTSDAQKSEQSAAEQESVTPDSAAEESAATSESSGQKTKKGIFWKILGGLGGVAAAIVIACACGNKK